MIGNLLGLDTFLVRRLKLSHTERGGVGRQAKDGADKESVWFSHTVQYHSWVIDINIVKIYNISITTVIPHDTLFQPYLLSSIPTLSLATINLFSIYIVLSFEECSINRIVKCVTF